MSGTYRLVAGFAFLGSVIRSFQGRDQLAILLGMLGVLWLICAEVNDLRRRG